MIKTSLLRLWVFPFLLFASCSPKLVGTWQIANYEQKIVGGQDIKVTNIGTMTFNKKNRGIKKINYSVLANEVSDTTTFSWTADEGVVSIASDGTELNKTWIVVEDGRKQQKWKSTDGANTVQTILLKKEKKKK